MANLVSMECCKVNRESRLVVADSTFGTVAIVEEKNFGCNFALSENL